MKRNSWFKSKLSEFKDDFDYRLEVLLLEITESIAKRMKEKRINRSELAILLNISPPAVTKILNGNSNFTLKTLLAISDAIDSDLNIKFKEKYSIAQKQINYSNSSETIIIDGETSLGFVTAVSGSFVGPAERESFAYAKAA